MGATGEGKVPIGGSTNIKSLGVRKAVRVTVGGTNTQVDITSRRD
jgi:hypothetical protein